MANVGCTYQVVGKYKNGREITAYHIKDIKTKKSMRANKDVLAFLIGAGRISNCKVQLNAGKGDVSFFGNGMSLEDLPVMDEKKGELKDGNGVIKIPRGATAQDVMEQYKLVGLVKSGRNTVAYVIQNNGCAVKKVSKEEFTKLAQDKKVSGITTQNYNGKVLIRSKDGFNFKELKVEQLDK